MARAATVLIDRAGRPAPHTAARSCPGPAAVRRLEIDAERLSVAKRIARAAARIEAGTCDDTAPPDSHALRPDQARVFRDFAAFLLDVAARAGTEESASPTGGGADRFGRIVLPPRTGKTVIAAHIIGRSGLRTTFIVPTKTLVEQTARELGMLLPGVPIGVYFGERKEVVRYGVNVATYSQLLRDRACGGLPEEIASSALVFADEAHRAMTQDRGDLLRQGFSTGAVHVALTATPDYDHERVLCRWFPRLVHEVTLEEALSLDLLAPARVWIAEVDAEGSRVQIVAGDYDEATLGRVMSAAPFARAVEVFRYRGTNARIPALITCATRQQARDLQQYLRTHRPVGTPPPEMVLGDTRPAERTRILEGFEAGSTDTLIQVGVLVEGWNSPRCKLLLDLAPTLSRVRATQKYFRVMTRHERSEARIYLLLPRGLPDLPILPMELFGRSCREYECGALLGAETASGGGSVQVEPADGVPVAGVALKKRIVLSARLRAPKLVGARLADVRDVLRSSRDFDPLAPCGLQRFLAVRFEHELFSGAGGFLLRWLGVSATTAAYATFLARTFPDGAVRLLLDESELQEPAPCRAEVAQLLGMQPCDVEGESAEGGGAPGHGGSEEIVERWRALTGLLPEPAIDPLERLIRIEEADEIAYLLSALPARRRTITARRFGLLDERPRTAEEIATELDVSTPRIREIVISSGRILLERGGSPERELRSRGGFAPPPHLAAFRGSCRGCRAWAAVEQERYRPHGWAELPEPLAVRDLLPRAGALLEALGRSSRVTTATPSFRRWMADGVEWGEAVWEADGARVALTRHGHATLRHEGDEAEVLRLRAEVSGLAGSALLLLEGRPGALCAFALEGDPSRAVESAWREVCGLEPPPRMRRDGGARQAPNSRQRR